MDVTETDLRNARLRLSELRLPSWVNGWELEEDRDQDGDPFIRVWLDVGDDFDVRGRFNEVQQVVEQVRKCMVNAGINELTSVNLRSPDEE